MTKSVTNHEVKIGLMPSRRDKCPKTGCGRLMEASPMEHAVLWRCPERHYEAIDVSPESVENWNAAQDSMITLGWKAPRC